MFFQYFFTFSLPFFYSRAEGSYFPSEGSQGNCPAHPGAGKLGTSRSTLHAPFRCLGERQRGNLGSFIVVVVELFNLGLFLTFRAPRWVFLTVIHEAFGGCYQQLPTGCKRGIKIFPSIIFQSFNTRAILSLLF